MKKLSSLTPWEKTRMFIVKGNKDFWKGGMITRDWEIYEYKVAGLPPPLYAMYGKYLPGKGYTVDPLADSLAEMQSRMIIW